MGGRWIVAIGGQREGVGGCGEGGGRVRGCVVLVCGLAASSTHGSLKYSCGRRPSANTCSGEVRVRVGSGLRRGVGGRQRGHAHSRSVEAAAV